MPESGGRRYPYTAPRQQHSKGRGSKATPVTDKSRAHISSAKGSSAGPQKKGSMAKRPEGTTIAAPGGRNSRARTY